MSNSNTGIEWTDKTWNPSTGCTKVSPGCLNCYAEVLTKRFPKIFSKGFEFTTYPARLDQPRHWRKPSRIFVNSMSDLFHENISFSYLQKVFAVMKETPWHIYQILTKREERLLELAPKLEWTDNIWMGVSVENQNYIKRIDALRQVPVKVRFLSCEPLLGGLELDLTSIHWVIVGGESGFKCRPIQTEWVQSILEQTQKEQVPFFFKQWGGRHSKVNGKTLDGKTWEQMPAAWGEHLKQYEHRISN